MTCCQKSFMSLVGFLFCLPFSTSLSTKDVVGQFLTVDKLEKVDDPDVITWLSRYDVTFPRQINMGRQKRGIDTQIHGDKLHLDDVSFYLKINQSEFILDLSRNKELLSGSFATSSYTRQGVITQRLNNTNNDHCYYMGKVRGIEGSHVRMSTCDGLQGYIELPDDFLLIHSIDGVKHAVYHPADDKRISHQERKCGASNLNSLTGNIYDRIDVEGMRRKRNVLGNRTLFVELMMVVDNFAWINGDYATMGSVEQRIKTIVNYMDGMFSLLNIRIVLLHLEVWSHHDPIPFSTEAEDVLHNFIDYRKNRTNNDPATSAWRNTDTAQLIYGGNFNGSVLGLAGIATMCGSSSAAVNQDSKSDIFLAGTIAHEMGHNMGMLHDTDSCSCPKPNCRMQTKSDGFDGLDVGWSSCSEDYLETSLMLGIGMCLENIPDPEKIYFGPQCGNLIVEAGEQCDSTSKCCNFATCRLARGAQCDAGRCCDNCQLAPTTQTCRATDANECDLPETCGGLSPHCPKNVFVEDGVKCNNGSNICYGGVCLTHELQCQSIWGEAATASHQVCYTLTNGLGNQIGNCGHNESGFIKCATQDVMCGKLQCAGGEAFPSVSRDRPFYLNHVAITDGSKLQCKTTQSNMITAGSDEIDIGLVRDGTSCDVGKACFKGECRNTSQPTCSSKCNGRGICNNMGNCHCDDGWAPPYCNTVGSGGSSDSSYTDTRVPVIVNDLIDVTSATIQGTTSSSITTKAQTTTPSAEQPIAASTLPTSPDMTATQFVTATTDSTAAGVVRTSANVTIFERSTTVVRPIPHSNLHPFQPNRHQREESYLQSKAARLHGSWMCGLIILPLLSLLFIK